MVFLDLAFLHLDHARGLHKDRRAGRNIGRNDSVGANLGAIPDSDLAKNDCPGADIHPVADLGSVLKPLPGYRTDRDILPDNAVVSDLAIGMEDDSALMRNPKPASDHCAPGNLDAVMISHIPPEHPVEQQHARAKQPLASLPSPKPQPMHGNRSKPRLSPVFIIGDPIFLDLSAQVSHKIVLFHHVPTGLPERGALLSLTMLAQL